MGNGVRVRIGVLVGAGVSVGIAIGVDVTRVDTAVCVSAIAVCTADGESEHDARTIATTKLTR